MLKEHPGPHVSPPVDAAPHCPECTGNAERIADLQREVTTLREAVESRQRIGVVTGLLAQRYGITPDDAWRLLARISQDLNVKVRQVAQVLHDGYCHRLAEDDVALAAQITHRLPDVFSGARQAEGGGVPAAGD